MTKKITVTLDGEEVLKRDLTDGPVDITDDDSQGFESLERMPVEMILQFGEKSYTVHMDRHEYHRMVDDGVAKYEYFANGN